MTNMIPVKYVRVRCEKAESCVSDVGRSLQANGWELNRYDSLDSTTSTIRFNKAGVHSGVTLGNYDVIIGKHESPATDGGRYIGENALFNRWIRHERAHRNNDVYITMFGA